MKTRHRVPFRPLLAFALGALSSSVEGQVIRGTVSAEGTGAPLRGAVVTLLDGSLSRTELRVLTDDRGAFAMRAPGAGSWAVEVRAIGYASRRTSVRHMNGGENAVESLVMRQLATRLATLRVEARSACRRAGELDAITSEVWDDVWAALSATDIAREQRLVRADVFLYTREVDAATGLVLHEERGVASVLDERPFRTSPPAELVRLGFWRQLIGGVEFHGLDAGIIISPEFLATHCFSLVRADSGGRSRIGLAFRPVNARTRADVQGTLWVDPESRELRQLQFTYTGLQLRGPAAGGTLRFTRLAEGFLVDDHWSLQHPYERTRSVGVRRTGVAESARIPGKPGTAMRIGGGFVLTDSARARQLATVAGIVRQGAAPADAVSVELLGSGQRFVTDSTGTFLIQDIVPGTYEMRIMRAGPAAGGGFVQHGQMVLAGGDLARVVLEVPDADSIAHELCPTSSGAGTAPLFGVLREEQSGRAAADYRIEVQWAPPADSAGTPLGRPGAVRTLTDWRGEFLACNMPAGSMASFRTTTGDAQWSLPLRMGFRLNVIEIAADTSGTR